MTDRVPLTTSDPDWDRALGWMVLVSGAVHLAGIALILLVPHSFLHQPPPLRSYTVDLVAPDRVGGNNAIQGGKGRIDAAPLAAAPPAPKVEPPKPPPPPKVEEAKPPEPKPEPPKPKEPEPQVAAKPEPKPEPPKVEDKPKEDEVALADKAKQSEPSPLPTAPEQVPSPQAKPAPSPKVVAKAEPAKPQPPSPAQPKIDPKAAKEAAASKERDDRIASAVKRVEQQAGKRGGGTGAKAAEQAGGPISVGPGEGAGGAVMGVEYLIYRNQLESRIKQNWAWAGNRSLEAAIHFSITEGGEVVDVRITKSSGDSSYDASIERAVRALNPLPPPPQVYRKQFSDVEYTFTPESLQM